MLKAERALKTVTLVVVGVGVAGAVGIMLFAGGGLPRDAASLGFLAWALLPYLPLALMSRVRTGSLTFAILLAAGSLGVVGFGLFVYVYAFLIELDAQSALVFIFVPLYQWAGVLVTAAVAVLGWLIAHLVARRAGARQFGDERDAEATAQDP